MICERFAKEGCNVAVNYLSSENKAKEVAANIEKYNVKATIIQGVCLHFVGILLADIGRMPVLLQIMPG